MISRQASRPASSRAQYLLRVGLIVAAYLLIAYPLNHLDQTRYLIGPISLHTGFAIAALLTWGLAMWPGVVLAYIGLVLVATERIGWDALNVALLLAVGHLLTAVAAVLMVRRWMRRGVLLPDLPSALGFLGLSTCLATMVGASWGTAVFILRLHLPGSEGPSVWIDWWLSDFGGALITMPITLCLIAEPRAVWRPRLFSVGLLSLLATALLVLVVGLMSRWDLQRQLDGFEREAEATASAIDNGLENATATLLAMRELLALGHQHHGHIYATLSRRQRAAGRIDAVGRAQWVAAGGPVALQTFDVSDSASDAQDTELLSAPALQAFILETEASGQLAASAGFRTPADLAGAPPRVAVLQTFKESPRPAGERELSDLAFMTLRPQQLIATVLGARGGRMKVCLIDQTPGAPADTRRLAGEPGCEKSVKYIPDLWRTLGFAGRSWRLRVYAAASPPLTASPEAKLIELTGIGCLALITALMLNQSGNAQRAASLIDERTSELQQTSQALRSNEQRFRSVFDHAPVGVCISALDGSPQDANPEFCRMLDCRRPELRKRYRPYRDADAELARRLSAAGETMLHEQRSFQHRDGSQLHADLMMTLLRDDEGRPEALLCVAQDITERLLLGEHERAREAAELANRAKSEFLSRMSHELRTPLNGLLGFTQLLQLEREPLRPTQRAWIERISQAGWHLLAMINDVLDLSRVETGNLQVVLEPQDLRALAQECMTLLTASAAKRSISLSIKLDPAVHYAMADATRVREILNNLLSNAIKYNVQGGSVQLALRLAAPELAEISVTDTGPGMSAEQLGALFQPFNRLGQERSGIEGTGIGLVITRRLAELMGGTLTVSSRPGQGSTFTLRLPAAQPPDQRRQEASSAHAAPLPWQGPRRLVYVEDNPVNVEVMRAVIALRESLSLSVFEDGASALAALEEAPPDLILLDMHLPDMDGLTVLRRLRELPGCAGLPVAIVSADAMDEHIARGLQGGALHYLTKPFAVNDLLGLIDRLLAPTAEHK